MKRLRNDKGMALLIVLLITALLVALIFEFAYATRVSLNAAVNFRDSERAYYLARSGVYAAVKYMKLLDVQEQKEWFVVPIVSGGDAELRIRWEDEKGKIKVTTLNPKTLDGQNAHGWMEHLFGDQGIGMDVLDRMEDQTFALITQAHPFMSEEDFFKIEKYVTVYSDGRININTASEEVLKCLGIDPTLIISTRSTSPYKSVGDVQGIDSLKAPNGLSVTNYLDVTSNVFKVYSYATVGGYTRQMEAVIQRSPFAILYWKAL